MPELHQNERLIINQLIDQSVFTSTLQKNMTNRTKEAIHALKRPQVQQRVNMYLRDLVGVLPENYQENLVFLANYKFNPNKPGNFQWQSVDDGFLMVVD
ncbi:hypothetical protein [Lactiplantibacillus argentoratensis]|uniref:hypothetical protein n=1 Tax=Lactiplantibacillus argentoratensis TaxID=271881 RepID=UPI0016514FC1|nr:hypothetical protein [Lactiplantibacillus argentoratensis]